MAFVTRDDFMPGFSSGLPMNGNRVRLIVPENPLGVLVLAATGFDQKHLALGLAERLGEAGLAVVMPGPNFEAWFGNGQLDEESVLAHRLADLGAWASEYLGAGLLPLAMLGFGVAAAPIAGAAALLGTALDALLICLPDAHIVETDLESIAAPTLFLSNGEENLDLKFMEALAFSMPFGSRAIPVQHRQLPLPQSLDWLQKRFNNFSAH